MVHSVDYGPVIMGYKGMGYNGGSQPAMSTLLHYNKAFTLPAFGGIFGSIDGKTYMLWADAVGALDQWYVMVAL